MTHKKTELKDILEKDIIDMIDDTSQLLADINVNGLTSSVTAIRRSNSLTNDIEFWKWMFVIMLNREYLIMHKQSSNI